MSPAVIEQVETVCCEQLMGTLKALVLEYNELCQTNNRKNENNQICKWPLHPQTQRMLVSVSELLRCES